MPRKKISKEQKERGLNLAATIQEAREDRGLTQEQLAIKAGIGVDTVRSIECGRIKAPNAFLIADIAKVLKGNLNNWLK